MTVFISLLVAILILTFVLNALESGNKGRNWMSFKESLDLVGLPIVTFKQGDKKFNFLLDTGASESVINANNVKDFVITPLEGSGTSFGIDGERKNVNYVSVNLEYNNNTYPHEYQVLDMQDALDNIKNEHGVTMVGILGNNFLEQYKYVLDFADFIAYQK